MKEKGYGCNVLCGILFHPLAVFPSGVGGEELHVRFAHLFRPLRRDGVRRYNNRVAIRSLPPEGTSPQAQSLKMPLFRGTEPLGSLQVLSKVPSRFSFQLDDALGREAV